MTSSIRTKALNLTLAPIVASALILFGSLTGFYFWQWHKFVDEREQLLLRQMAYFSQQVNDQTLFQNLSDLLLQETDIQAIAIVDSDYQPLFESHPPVQYIDTSITLTGDTQVYRNADAKLLIHAITPQSY